MVRALVIIALVTVAALATAEGALACSCVPIAPETQLKRADGAVIARLLAVKEPEQDSASFPSARFVYRTGRVYKGGRRLKRGRRLVVSSPPDDGLCGLFRQVGRLTGLFLSREHGRWHSNVCSEVTPRQMRRAGRGAGSLELARGCAAGASLAW